MLKGFKDFILRGNVIDLAVAVVIGAAFKDIVTAVVDDLINPLISIMGGKPDFSRFYLNVYHSKFLIGNFINSVLSFLIIAGIIYFLVITPMNKLTERTKKREKANPTDKPCPFCLNEIPVKATRCGFCTSQLKK